jgi:hypothetical protein
MRRDFSSFFLKNPEKQEAERARLLSRIAAKQAIRAAHGWECN